MIQEPDYKKILMELLQDLSEVPAMAYDPDDPIANCLEKLGVEFDRSDCYQDMIIDSGVLDD